ncbi:MAG: hypothetical protein QW767_06925 [Thermoprotei archaeon]
MSSNTGPVDIREQIAENRGAIKKLELLVPGLRTYRKLDDIRVADNILRNQVADKLLAARTNLDTLRKQMADAGYYSSLTTVGSLMANLQQLAGQVRHGEEGYAGIAASFSIDDEKLNKLYEYDYDFVQAAFDVADSTSSDKVRFDSSNPASVNTVLDEIQKRIQSFRDKWSVRIEYMEGVLLK